MKLKALYASFFFFIILQIIFSSISFVKFGESGKKDINQSIAEIENQLKELESQVLTDPNAKQISELQTKLGSLKQTLGQVCDSWEQDRAEQDSKRTLFSILALASSIGALVSIISVQVLRYKNRKG